MKAALVLQRPLNGLHLCSPQQGNVCYLRCALNPGPLWFPSGSEAGLRRTPDQIPSRCACCSADSASLAEGQNNTHFTFRQSTYASKMVDFSHQKQYKEVGIVWFQPRAKASHFISTVFSKTLIHLETKRCYCVLLGDVTIALT